MTEIEQKAEEYLKAQCLKRKDCLVLEMPDHYITDVRQAYIDGATENGIQWHDLRKGPNDLPVMETELLCQKYSGRCFVGYYNHADKKFYPYEKGNSYDVVDIVRWADIGIWWNIPTV